MDSVCFYCLFLTELKKEMHHVLQKNEGKKSDATCKLSIRLSLEEKYYLQ